MGKLYSLLRTQLGRVYRHRNISFLTLNSDKGNNKYTNVSHEVKPDQDGKICTYVCSNFLQFGQYDG